ncbi:MAG: type II secretion system F family protein [Clostridia bacterium]|nr:type II secretion system F family protein [Clostridia bacterium]
MAKAPEIKTLPPEECALFCEQLGMVLRAGIPLYDGMETLKQSYEGSRYGGRFAAIYQRLLESGSLSDAIEEAGIFPRYLAAMARIGERAGKLDEVMAALADYYRWEAELRASIKNAVLYPAVLVLMLAAVIAILIASVLPVFRQVFESLGLGAGGASASAMRFGMALGTAVLAFIGLIVLALIALALLLKSRRRTRVFDWLCRVLPPIGRASEQLSAGRFCSVLTMMLTAGYQLDAAMELAPTVVTDERYKSRILACAEAMKAGEPIAEAMSRAGLFSGMHDKMVRFGAAAGQLDGVMERLREAYMQAADDSIGQIVSRIEPTLVTLLSVVIGGILLAVMLPLLSILSAVG